MFCGERVHSSPTVPTGTSSPVSVSTRRISTHEYGLPHERSNWSVPDNCRIKPHHPEELHGEAINLSETCADLEPRVADRPVRFQDELDEGVAMNVRFREVAMNLAYESSRLGRFVGFRVAGGSLGEQPHVTSGVEAYKVDPEVAWVGAN